ncbi:MOSC domain-containing protein [Pelagicoccus sp. SDUM812003]|uniref:MOSC domain-containing protein n=1 Tax=Pelagicoccus sp. SDUM812003 TaxID=3041267 RepID=UPI00280FBC1D|nr:MOSC domain-containing protein [Pelagicoccus sp. SDUM812003]MDQ8201532.1 MOSC domain-containing protein [Pelagicoccus sp. SDUM812003]
MKESITIRSIFLSTGHDFKGRHGQERLNHGIQSVESVDCVQGKGLKGDRYFGFEEDFKGQISFISAEDISDMERELALTVEDRSAFRRNVVVSGVDLNQLVGKRFEVGGVEFVGTEQCKPCYWMDKAVAPGACAALKDRGGLRCRILSSGTLRLGEHDLSVLS